MAKKSPFRVRALAKGALLTLASPALAQAQPAPATPVGVQAEQRSFSITAQPLGRAALLFSDQARVQLVLGPQVVDGIRSSEVRGRYTVSEALNRMLAGTGLSWRYLNPRVVTIERPASGDNRVAPPDTGVRTFGAVTVQGQANAGFADVYSLGRASGANGSSDPTATQGTGSLTTNGTSVASRFPQPLQQTTQSVSILTRERLDQQNLTELNTALNFTPGITIQPSNGTDATFLSRAFPLENYVVDGGATLGFTPFAHGSFDLSEYDHIEVLRGSAGQYVGSGQPSGVISLQRKRPLDHNQLLAELQGGSFNFYRGEVDVTGPLALKGALRGRIVAAYQDRDFFYDVAHERKLNVYGVIEGDVTPNTLVRVGASYGRQRNPGVNQSGLPLYATGDDTRLPRSTCFCAPWARQNVNTTEAFGSIEQKFGTKWLFKVDGTYKRTDEDTITPILNADNLLPGRVNQFSRFNSTVDSNGRETQLALNATLSGAFTLFGREQRILAGYDYAHNKYDNSSTSYRFPLTPDVFGFDPASLGTAPDLSAKTGSSKVRSTDSNSGAYAFLTLEPLRGLHVMGGTRYTTLRGDSDSLREFVFGPDFSFVLPGSSRTRDHYWVPSASLSYDLTDRFAAYASYNTIRTSQFTNRDKAGNPLPTSDGATTEIGLRAKFADGKLNASVSGYYTTVNNLASLTGFSPLTGDYYYEPLGKYTSKGVDVEVAGQIHPGWQVQASYNFNDNKSRFPEGPFIEMSGRVATQQPKHQVKLWTSYALAGLGDTFDRFTVGGGLRFESQRSTFGRACVIDPAAPTTCGSSTPFFFAQEAYAVGDLFVNARITKKLGLSVNVTNITDTRYYAVMATPSGGNFYGEPRAVSVRLQAKF